MRTPKRSVVGHLAILRDHVEQKHTLWVPVFGYTAELGQSQR